MSIRTCTSPFPRSLLPVPPSLSSHRPSSLPIFSPSSHPDTIQHLSTLSPLQHSDLLLYHRVSLSGYSHTLIHDISITTFSPSDTSIQSAAPIQSRSFDITTPPAHVDPRRRNTTLLCICHHFRQLTYSLHILLSPHHSHGRIALYSTTLYTEKENRIAIAIKPPSSWLSRIAEWSGDVLRIRLRPFPIQIDIAFSPPI